MPRPRKGDREAVHLTLDKNLKGRVDLFLFSNVEGRVPYGAWVELIDGLLRQWLNNMGVKDDQISVRIQQDDSAAAEALEDGQEDSKAVGGPLSRGTD
jgi:hypothetical protein